MPTTMIISSLIIIQSVNVTLPQDCFHVSTDTDFMLKDQTL